MTAPGLAPAPFEHASPEEGGQVPLYPLRFDPIYQYRLWGGRQLADILRLPLPADGPIGEAWLLSDRPDHQSLVGDGPLRGWALGQLLERFPQQMMGTPAPWSPRFPLLLKFLDARGYLSVQVHPSDQETRYLPEGETGKTEAWVVLEAAPGSRLYAGLRPGTTGDTLRQAARSGAMADHLAWFAPTPGDVVLLPAGTVHCLGGGVVAFEVQQNSDVTLRLYDWDHVDAETGQRRALQVDEAIACTDFAQVAVGPVVPAAETTTPVARERLIDCEHFGLWRVIGDLPFTVGAVAVPRVLVCTDGAGHIEHNGNTYAVGRGDVVLLPAVVGTCWFRPATTVTVLEVAFPTAVPGRRPEAH